MTKLKPKYKLTTTSCYLDSGHVTVYKIQALRDFSNVKKGDMGGWIQCESNLSHYGNCWVYDEAKVYGNQALISDNAKVSGHAIVHDKARVYQEASVFGNADVSDVVQVFGNAEVSGTARIRMYTRINGTAKLFEDGLVFHNHK